MGDDAKVRGGGEGGICKVGTGADSRNVPGKTARRGNSLGGVGAGPTRLTEVWSCPRCPTRRSPRPLRSQQRRSRYADFRNLCVCCSRGCPSHRHLARTCVGESQWHGFADDGHVRAEPDRIDCAYASEEKRVGRRKAGPASLRLLLRASWELGVAS